MHLNSNLAATRFYQPCMCVLILKDKKAALEKERQKRIEQAENIISERSIEQKKLESILLPLGLVVKEVAMQFLSLLTSILFILINIFSFFCNRLLLMEIGKLSLST